MKKSPSEKFMTGTAALSFLATAASIFLYHRSASSPWLSCAITCGTICYHFTMRLLVGLCIRKLIRSPLDPKSAWFAPRTFEAPFFEKLRVKRWKDRLPTYYPETFSLRERSLSEVIQTMCISELSHEIMAVLSFLPLLMAVPFGEFPVFLCTSLAAAAVDTIFVILQRYNRPRLVRAAQRLKR